MQAGAEFAGRNLHCIVDPNPREKQQLLLQTPM
jgi:hypothetical protein